VRGFARHIVVVVLSSLTWLLGPFLTRTFYAIRVESSATWIVMSRNVSERWIELLIVENLSIELCLLFVVAWRLGVGVMEWQLSFVRSEAVSVDV